MALDMLAYLEYRRSSNSFPVDFRIGISSGPVIGGVIGHKKFVYDIWGDAVNLASRMESQGVPGRIQITEATHRLIQKEFHCERRGTLQVKGRGDMETWFLVGRSKKAPL
jgi:adenylate cyclase